jgi:hypothetical protein
VAKKIAKDIKKRPEVLASGLYGFICLLPRHRKNDLLLRSL